MAGYNHRLIFPVHCILSAQDIVELTLSQLLSIACRDVLMTYFYLYFTVNTVHTEYLFPVNPAVPLPHGQPINKCGYLSNCCSGSRPTVTKKWI